MKKWETLEINSGALIHEERIGKIEIASDKSYIYFNRKHYTIVKTFINDDNVVYEAECIRHTGHRHIKYETSFMFTPIAVGYTEIISIEI